MTVHRTAGTSGCDDCGCGRCRADLPTPASTYNPPGLPELSYRVGTHGQFMASMLDRLAGRAALVGLRTRAPDDPAIALLDCWAVVADVLTVYVERTAQEGYLGTATEPASFLQLGRLAGFRPRPALGSGGYLAYTLDPDAHAVVPAGSRALSVPAQGQLPQTFETAEDLDADAAWNQLAVRVTAPPRVDPGTAEALDRLVLVGSALNLKAGDRILLLFGASPEPAVRVVLRSTPDFALARTVVDLVPLVVPDATQDARAALDRASSTAPGEPMAAPLREAIRAASDELDFERADADDVYARLATAARLLSEGVAFLTARPGADLSAWLDGDVASARRAVRAALVAVAERERRSLPEVEYLRALAGGLAGENGDVDETSGAIDGDRTAALVATAAVLPALRRPASTPPRAGRYLDTGPGDRWDPRSDALPGLLAAADPRLSAGVHQAWTTQQIAPPRPASGVQALRVKARPVAPPAEGTPVILLAAPGAVDPITLDGALDSVLPGSWLVTEQVGSVRSPFRVRVTAVDQLRVPVPTPAGAPPITAPVTVVRVDGPWHDDPENDDQGVPFEDITVWAAGEDLTLADEPITDDVGGSRIDLAQVRPGLRAGRRLVVSGERTDIPGTSGVRGSELTMLAAIQQSVDPALGGDTVHPVLVLATPLAYTYKRDTVTIHGNVVAATQGESRSEALGSGDAARAGQSFALRQVSATAPLTHLPADTPGGAEPALTVRVDGIRWHRTDDLSRLGPLDRGYLLTEEAGTAAVVFGDGVHGSRLPTGVANVTAAYRTGAGADGNLPPGRITQLVSRPLGVSAVTNPLPMTGGTDADGPQDTRAGIPLRSLALDRLVSVDDYAHFSRSRAGIGRASAVRLHAGRRDVVHVTVAAAGDVPIDVSDPLLSSLATALADFGDPYLAVRVEVRDLVLLVLSAGVKVLPDHSFDTVEPAVRAALLGALGFAARDLAQPAYLSEVLAAAQAVAGVDYVDVDMFAGIAATADPLALLDLASSLQGVGEVVDARPARVEPAEHVVGVDPTGAEDTLTSIALRHGRSVEEIVALNPAMKSATLRQGQRIVVGSSLRPAQLSVLSPDLPETLILRRIP